MILLEKTEVVGFEPAIRGMRNHKNSPMRKNHKLDEWQDFCHWVEGLPYSCLITREKE